MFLKKYTANLIAEVNEHNPDRGAIIKSRMPAYANTWAKNFDRIRIYVTEGDGFDVRGTLIVMTQDTPFGEEKSNDKCRITVLADSVVQKNTDGE